MNFDLFTLIEIFIVLLILIFFIAAFVFGWKQAGKINLPLTQGKKLFFSITSGFLIFFLILACLLISDVFTPNKTWDPQLIIFVLFIVLIFSMVFVVWSYVNISIIEKVLIWFRSLQYGDIE